MAFPVMPALHGYSIHKRPTFVTTVRTPRSGREVTRYQQTLPLWEFELTYEILQEETQNQVPDSYFANKTDLQQIAGLFAACGGEFGFFYFEDTSDNSRTQQGLGVGDGVTTAFRLLRTISFGDITYTEPVGGINLDHSIVVYVDGTPVSQSGNWSISDDLRFLVFDDPPGGSLPIEITYYYFYLCRFIVNEAEFEEFLYNRWSQKGLRFRSVNIHAVGDVSPIYTDPFTPPIPPTPTDELPPGGYYWEVAVVEGGQGYIGWGVAFGVCNSSVELTDTVNALSNTDQVNCQFSDFMTIEVDGVGAGAPAWGYPARPTAFGTHHAVADGQVYSVAVNTITHLLWWRAVAGADVRWNANALANPATGVGGIDISAGGLSPVVGDLYAMLGATVGAAIFVGPYDSPSVGTANFGDSAFAGVVPSGFVSPSSVLGVGVCKLDPAANGGVALSGGDLTFTGLSPVGASNQGNPYDCVRSTFHILQAP